VVAQSLEKRDVLRWLPSTLDTLPIEALDGARVIRNAPDQPHNVLSALTQCVDTDIEIFRWMSTIASPALVAAYWPLFQNSGTDARVVFTEPVLAAFTGGSATVQALQEFGSYVEKEATRQRGTIRCVTGPLSVHLAICDETRVILAPAPTTEMTDATAAGLESTDSAVVRWATAFFDTKYAEGNPPDAPSVKQAKGRSTHN
jgi:predicted transcriptional regulator